MTAHPTISETDRRKTEEPETWEWPAALRAHFRRMMDSLAGAPRPMRTVYPRWGKYQDRNKYSGAQLRALRAERGVGRPCRG